MRRPGLGTALAAAALALGGCLGTPKLMTPGAQGVTFQLWGDPAAPPTVIQADRLEQVIEDPKESGGRQRSTGFEHMRFEALRVRRPFGTGVVFLQSPRGEYRKDASDEVALEGPVRLAGSMNGEPFIGVGERAVLHHETGQIELIGDEAPAAEQDPRRLAVVVLRGSAARSRHFVFDDIANPGVVQGTKLKGAQSMRMSTAPYAFNQAADVPAVALALAALPHPLVMPDLVVEVK
jgi:hypothetical protein